MRAPLRLSLYGLLLVMLFGTSYLLGDLLVPVAWVDSWSGSTSH